MTDLRLGPGLTLPLDVVTEATGIVATRGAGKSSASAVIVEEAVAAGVQVVVFDRTGVYWGLQSNAKGDRAGLAVYVIGGPHGNVPLEATAGRMLADLAVDSGHSLVLDLSDLSKTAATRFAGDFLEHLYDRKARSRSTMLVVVDEAHFYAPQTPRGGFKGESAKLMGAMEDVVGLGRSRGLGVVLTTQRTQSLNKAVLDLIETLLVMRMLSPRARDAVRLWIQEKHEDDDAGVLASLSSLPTGTAWVWSPLRGILEKVPVRRIRTFDTYKTPEPGQVPVEPAVRKELDLTALGERIAATVEQAKANDPAELRRRILALEGELAGHRCPDPAPAEPVEVPVLDAEARALIEQVMERWDRAYDDATEAVNVLRDGLAAVRNARENVPAAARKPAGQGRTPSNTAPVPTAPVSRKPPVNGAESDVRLRAGARRILDTIVGSHPAGLTQSQAATRARLKRTGGTFGSYWSNLRAGGLITQDAKGLWRATDDGFARAGVAPGVMAQSGEQIREQWRGVLRKGARVMLDELIAAWPNGIDRANLAARADLEASGGTFGSYLSNLRANGLVAVTGSTVRASDDLFPEETP